MSRDLDTARELMLEFARRTGLMDQDRQPARYLWTDAFAVCNFLGLARATGDDGFLKLAHDLVSQVHATLGYHRQDDTRHGPLSGLGAREALEHPTAGGLRIGKPLPERHPSEALDPELEWERDGQYFHYLTKWMHALAQMARATGDVKYNRWARELARAAHAAFTRRAGPGRMWWKMSIDLTRPLVTSMGQHDPLDALVTYAQLEATPGRGGPGLGSELRAAAEMCQGASWLTADPLGIGGLLIDASRVAQLPATGALADASLLIALLDSASVGLAHWVRSGALAQSAHGRLAFRELGLAIGLAGLQYVLETSRRRRGHDAPARGSMVDSNLERIAPYVPLRERLTRFWREPANRRAHLSHRDIDEVMLATSLAPDGFLRLTARTA